MIKNKLNFYRNKLSNQLKDKDFAEILKGGAVNFLTKAITVFIGILFSFIITNYYGAEEMGVFSIVNSYFTIAIIVSMMGLHTAILRFIPEQIVKYSLQSAFKLFIQVFKLVFFMSVIVAITACFLSDFIAVQIFENKNLVFVFSIAAFFIVIQALGKLSHETIRALKNIKIYGLLEVSVAVFKITLLGILTYFFYQEYNSVYTLFASFVFLFIGALYFVFSLFSKKKYVEATVKISSNKEIITVAFPMFLTGVMSVVISQTDIVMLGAMSNVTEVGIYAIAVKLAFLTSFILTSINSIATPKFSELFHAGKMEALTSIAQKSSKLVFWISAPIMIVFIFFGEFLLSIFGDEFVKGYPVLILLALGKFVNGIAGSVGSFLNMTGHQKVFNRIVIIGGLTNILFNFILIPKYGIIGAAIASMLSIILWNLLASLYIKYKFGFFIGYLPINLKSKKSNE